MNKSPIGIFDSGVGGTTVWKEIYKLLPNENTLYLADSKNAPYGYKSKEEIITLSIKNTEKLLEFGAKMIVVACNTATTNAIEVLRSHYNIPIIGIEPAVKPAALNTETKSIGVLATKGTINSSLFLKTSEAYTKDIKVVEIIGKGLVKQVEDNQISSETTKNLLKKYLKPMLDANVDYIVLGCTHYPYLISEIKKIIPSNIKIIDSGEAVAKRVQNILKSHGIEAPPEKGNHCIYTNKTTETLQSLLVDYSKEITISELDF